MTASEPVKHEIRLHTVLGALILQPALDQNLRKASQLDSAVF
jgi:hypothetical protein